MITEGSAQLPMLVTDDNIGNRILVGPDLASAPIVYSANELNQYTEITGGTTVNPLYDLDGNCTNDGVFAFAWDAENRLTSVSSNGNVIALFKYDYMSRRYEKTAGAVTHSFIYDGWNLLEEQSRRSLGEGGSTTNFYIWGLDLSGSLQGAGGIGGLVGMVHGAEGIAATYIPFGDANGNITDYVDANGTVVAHKEFDAYGNTIAKAGTMGDDFRFWFSSKYWDAETGLGYWGYRYYHPDEGRWLGRDTIQENGGSSHRFAYVQNNPIDFLDPDGREKYPKDEAPKELPYVVEVDYQNCAGFALNNGYSLWVRDGSTWKDVATSLGWGAFKNVNTAEECSKHCDSCGDAVMMYVPQYHENKDPWSQPFDRKASDGKGYRVGDQWVFDAHFVKRLGTENEMYDSKYKWQQISQRMKLPKGTKPIAGTSENMNPDEWTSLHYGVELAKMSLRMCMCKNRPTNSAKETE